jgi:hypothetical protein
MVVAAVGFAEDIAFSSSAIDSIVAIEFRSLYLSRMFRRRADNLVYSAQVLLEREC